MELKSREDETSPTPLISSIVGVDGLVDDPFREFAFDSFDIVGTANVDGIPGPAVALLSKGGGILNVPFRPLPSVVRCSGKG